MPEHTHTHEVEKKIEIYKQFNFIRPINFSNIKYLFVIRTFSTLLKLIQVDCCLWLAVFSCCCVAVGELLMQKKFRLAAAV